MPKDGVLLEKTEITITPKLRSFWKSKGVGTNEMKKLSEMSKKIRLYKIVYQSNGYRVNGFLCEPRGGKKKLPCIIWNRGGLGEFGSIKIGTAFGWMGQIADWGYVVIGTQYSGNGGSEGKEDYGGIKTTNDVLNLKLILDKTPRADTSRIGMFGASRGGMMTYRCLSKVKWIKAAAVQAGLADLDRMEKLRPEMRMEAQKIGVKTKVDRDQRSAVKWPQKFCKKTPLLMVHGTADWRVSALDSIDLARLLYGHKVPYRLVLYEGDDHFMSEHHNERNQIVREWFDRYVRDGSKLPNLKLHGE